MCPSADGDGSFTDDDPVAPIFGTRISRFSCLRGFVEEFEVGESVCGRLRTFLRLIMNGRLLEVSWSAQKKRPMKTIVSPRKRGVAIIV